MTTKGVCPQTWLRENGKPVCIRICSFPLDALAHASNCPSLLETHDIYTMVGSLAKVYKELAQPSQRHLTSLLGSSRTLPGPPLDQAGPSMFG